MEEVRQIRERALASPRPGNARVRKNANTRKFSGQTMLSEYPADIWLDGGRADGSTPSSLPASRLSPVRTANATPAMLKIAADAASRNSVGC